MSVPDREQYRTPHSRCVAWKGSEPVSGADVFIVLRCQTSLPKEAGLYGVFPAPDPTTRAVSAQEMATARSEAEAEPGHGKEGVSHGARFRKPPVSFQLAQPESDPLQTFSGAIVHRFSAGHRKTNVYEGGGADHRAGLVATCYDLSLIHI
eukprot:926392-Rhodomonas_salina.5